MYLQIVYSVNINIIFLTVCVFVLTFYFYSPNHETKTTGPYFCSIYIIKLLKCIIYLEVL
jgi:hypothetical protein